MLSDSSYDSDDELQDFRFTIQHSARYVATRVMDERTKRKEKMDMLAKQGCSMQTRSQVPKDFSSTMAEMRQRDAKLKKRREEIRKAEARRKKDRIKKKEKADKGKEKNKLEKFQKKKEDDNPKGCKGKPPLKEQDTKGNPNESEMKDDAEK